MGKPAKLTAPLTALSDLASLMPPVEGSPVEGSPVEGSPVDETNVVPPVQPSREQDEDKFAAELDACLDELARDGETKADGEQALTNAGIKCTRWVYERKMNESHVEAAYLTFSTAHKNRGGDAEMKVDKTAKSRFASFFKPEVVAFVHGREGVNENWHEGVKSLRRQLGVGNCVSLYNCLITFNREVIKAKNAAPSIITSDLIAEKILKKAADPKTLEGKLLALKKTAETIFTQSGAPEMDKWIIDNIQAYLDALQGTDWLKMVVLKD